MESWRYALASVIGTSHLASGMPCQDAGTCQIVQDANGTAVLVALVADGAGSAAHADEGAALACEQLLSTIRRVFADGVTVSDLEESFVLDAMSAFRSVVQERAAIAGTTPRDYACTSLGALVAPEQALFWQVGDGAIVIGHPGADDYECVFWPQAGEYANHTYFATDADVATHVEVRAVAAPVDEVALFSDGLQRLALHFASQRAHTPFFRPIFQTVRPARAGHARELSAALADYLGSERVSAQTDDDKTLILATRRLAGDADAEPARASDEATDASV